MTLSRDALRSFVDPHPRMMHRVIQLLIGYVRIRLRLTQRMVAAGRENVNRGRARFETSGAIRQDGGCITNHPSRETTRTGLGGQLATNVTPT